MSRHEFQVTNANTTSTGNTITGGRIDGHCDNSTWVGYYKDCMECALEYNIWRFYEDGVTAAASPCRLDAVPVPSGVDMTDPSSTAASDSSIVSPSGSTTAPTMPQSSAVSSNATVTTAPPGTESSTPVSTSPPGTVCSLQPLLYVLTPNSQSYCCSSVYRRRPRGLRQRLGLMNLVH